MLITSWAVRHKVEKKRKKETKRNSLVPYPVIFAILPNGIKTRLSGCDENQITFVFPLSNTSSNDELRGSLEVTFSSFISFFSFVAL